LNVLCKFSLRLGSRVLHHEATVPAAPASIQQLLPVLQNLTDHIVAVSKEGAAVSCKPGCGACCRQLVPISRSEARFLSNLVATLSTERRRTIEQRFHRAFRRLRELDLLDRVRNLQAQVRTALGRDYFLAAIPCPFLENESCGIYPDRPLSCREYLVASPAANCADPVPGRVQVPAIPAEPSAALYRVENGYLSLILALEWTASHADPSPTVPGPHLLEKFVRSLSR
jgi:Fe-S-cluster containining protein